MGRGNKNINRITGKVFNERIYRKIIPTEILSKISLMGKEPFGDLQKETKNMETILHGTFPSVGVGHNMFKFGPNVNTKGQSWAAEYYPNLVEEK